MHWDHRLLWLDPGLLWYARGMLEVHRMLLLCLDPDLCTGITVGADIDHCRRSSPQHGRGRKVDGRRTSHAVPSRIARRKLRVPRQNSGDSRSTAAWPLGPCDVALGDCAALPEAMNKEMACSHPVHCTVVSCALISYSAVI